MKLKKLLKNLDYTLKQGSLEANVSNIATDSRKVNSEDLFVCIIGSITNGHNLVQDVIKSGVKTIVASEKISVPEDVNLIYVEDSRYALAIISSNFFNNPQTELHLIGVSGTKGKTSVSYMIKQILEKQNINVGLIGTIEITYSGISIPTQNTTPDSYTIQKYLREMVNAGCDYAVIEVSSQALKLDRTAGIDFDASVFTNLGIDHIGINEHEDFNDYRECKAKLFQQSKIGIGNLDDENYDEIFKNSNCKKITYSIEKDSDFKAENIKNFKENSNMGVEFTINGISFKAGIPGRFNVYNAAASLATIEALNLSITDAKKALYNIRIEGRTELINISPDFTLMIDYAHNKMSLEALLSTLIEFKPKRLITLFGGAGSRASSRRLDMGEISGKYSDLTIITTSDSRFEDPEDLMEDIAKGVRKSKGEYVKILDRKDAIKFSIEKAQKGDLIVLTEKGHERTHEINGIKYEITEKELIRKALSELNLEIKF